MRKILLSLLALIMPMTTLASAPSGSLPVIYINTEGEAEITSKENYVKATYYLDPNGCEDIQAIGSEDSPLDLQIRGRGNYTWTGFDKKPYRLKLGKKQKMPGMNSSKHWALLAHADDNRGFLRNAVGFQLSRLVGLPWTPGYAPVEVVLNGDYIGLYFLTETVRIDSKRVDIFDYDSEYEDYADANPGLTLPWKDEYAAGGWLVEIDNYVDSDQVEFESIDPNVPDRTLRVTYDSPSDYITDAHKSWLLNEFRDLDAMIVNGNRDACQWADRIDLTNLARFFVVNQIVYNYESFHGSCKLYRDLGTDAKWNFGPVWDFGSAFQDFDNKMFFDFGPYSNHWIKTMYEYPTFREEVNRVYASLRDGGYDTIYPFIDSFIAHISSAAAADLERWPQYGNSDLAGKASYVKEFLRKSIAFLDSEWEYADGSADDRVPTSDIYLRGTFNNWEARPEYRFSESSNGLYTLHVDELTGEWKLAGPEWDEGNVDFGGASGIIINTPVNLTYHGTNCSLADTDARDLTLIFDWKEKTLTVSDTPLPAEPLVIYFADTKSTPWNQTYVFTWNPAFSAWPGTEMEKVKVDDGRTLWKFTFEGTDNLPCDGETGIIFNNGRTGVESGNQTADFIFHNGAVYTMNGELTGGVTNIIDTDAEDKYYTLQGIRVTHPEHGIYILRRGSDTRKVILP